MGIYPNGLAPDVDLKAIQQTMLAPMSGWWSAHIQVWDYQRSTPGVYDPIADTTTGAATPILIFDSGPNGAAIQNVRLAAMSPFGDQAVGTRSLHFQTHIDASSVRSGLVVRVLDGGNDPSLTEFEYVIEDGTNASNAWGRIYQARARV